MMNVKSHRQCESQEQDSDEEWEYDDEFKRRLSTLRISSSQTADDRDFSLNSSAVSGRITRRFVPLVL